MTQTGPVGFIGLGVMGGAMVRRLIGAGYEVHIHARNPDRAAPFLEHGAHWAGDVATLARSCRTVFTIVGGPDDVAALYLGGAGLIANAAPGAVVVDMTTSTPDLARQIASKAVDRGLSALDAPVTGGAPGAEAGTLTFMVGGEAGALEAVRPMLWTMGANIFSMGPAGAGQTTKASNQVAVAGILMGLAEALHHAETAGLAPDKVLEVLTTGTAGGPLMRRLGPKMVVGDTTASFAIDRFIKDLGIALDATALPGTTLCRDLYRNLSERGGGAKGLQALIEHYRRTRS